MTFVFLAILVMAWAIVFLPAIQRATKETPLRSAEHFRRGMQVIAPGYEQVLRAREKDRQMALARVSRPAAAGPRHRAHPARSRPAVPREMPRIAKGTQPGSRTVGTRVRRMPSHTRAHRTRKQLHRQALGVLLTLAGWSGIAALFLGGGYWELHLAIDASIGLYAIYLFDERRRAIERATKVRTLRRGPARMPQRRPVRPSDIRLHETWAAVEEG